MKYVLIIICVLTMMSCGGGKEDLSGAGATFPAPFYNIVFREYTQQSGINVTYGAVGSGGGIRSLQDKTVDFGATDVFLSEEELKEMNAEVLHIPTALGAVVLSYNLPDMKELNLTSEVISEIYRGKITRWNDEKIKALNPSGTLPDQAITPVYRSDGSGTAYVFSEFMSKTDSVWNSEIGTGKSLQFSVGIAAKGNPGVAGVISETTGAIGYIGSEYAFTLNMPSARIRNREGKFIAPETKSISIAAESLSPDNRTKSLTDPSRPDAYPISTFTWIVVYKEQNYNNRSKERADALKNLLSFMVGEEGQNRAVKTHYAPLPPSVARQASETINSITYSGK